MDPIDLYCAIGRERLLNQEWLHREYGTKASVLVGFGGILVGAGVAIVTIPATDHSWFSFGVFMLVAVAFLWSSLWSSTIFWTKDWNNGPCLLSLPAPPEIVGNSYRDAVTDNWRVLDKLSNRLRLGVTGLMAEAIALATLGIITIFPY